jgi:hypothetical protein
VTRRLLPTAVWLFVALCTLYSLGNLWGMLSMSASDAVEQRAALIGGDCAALPRLAASHPEELTLALMQELATHHDERLRELTAHQAWTPHISIKQQIKVVRALEPEQLRTRCELWLTRRATSQNTLTLSELRTYWNSKQ